MPIALLCRKDRKPPGKPAEKLKSCPRKPDRSPRANIHSNGDSAAARGAKPLWWIGLGQRFPALVNAPHNGDYVRAALAPGVAELVTRVAGSATRVDCRRDARWLAMPDVCESRPEIDRAALSNAPQQLARGKTRPMSGSGVIRRLLAAVRLLVALRPPLGAQVQHFGQIGRHFRTGARRQRHLTAVAIGHDPSSSGRIVACFIDHLERYQARSEPGTARTIPGSTWRAFPISAARWRSPG